MEPEVSKGQAYATLLLRLIVAAVMITAGYGKVQDIEGFQNYLTGQGIWMPEYSAYLAAYGEFAGGLCLIPGLLTRVAGFMIASTMGVATFFVHWDEGFIVKGGGGYAFPLTLMIIALSLVFSGAGPLSIDHFFASLFNRNKIQKA